MKRKVVVSSGKTLEEAIEAGLRELGAARERVNVTVLEQPNKGLFGLIGARPAKVQLELEPDAVEETEQFLREVLEAIGLQANVEVDRDREGATIRLNGSDMGLIIGRRGQALDALQYLANIVANRYSDKFVRIVIDAENFRERRRQTLEELSDRLAERVSRSGKEIVLEPMSSQERKIIHSRLQNHPHVRTFSKGEDPNRRVVIAAK
ncbi:RNA-binding cell elongation regulator Jag/EloR [Paenibacillus thermoaerophilus]|jgi:spoIIIJ-associated protein|uniref:RNA-binding protein KhpB n=1 Tax=Paenibacillus thermoaerophilus TaxID=1215385 RepID=A0ABW2UZV2_9BACL|nr:RNA-binding cell elongation regulator Jag/EloR [Paenibacillus thermoaerophilus]TMV06680.1 protein jag [Paenibacillus thermoaerophilus]